LVDSLKDGDPRVRHAAVQALAAIGEAARAAMPALVALRDDPSDLVRWQAGEVLKAWRE
jgi:HEAT repeat protein